MREFGDISASWPIAARIRSGHPIDSGSRVVAFYRVIDDAENGATVEVLRIIDGRRDLRTVFFTG